MYSDSERALRMMKDTLNFLGVEINSGLPGVLEKPFNASNRYQDGILDFFGQRHPSGSLVFRHPNFAVITSMYGASFIKPGKTYNIKKAVEENSEIQELNFPLEDPISFVNSDSFPNVIMTRQVKFSKMSICHDKEENLFIQEGMLSLKEIENSFKRKLKQAEDEALRATISNEIYPKNISKELMVADMYLKYRFKKYIEPYEIIQPTVQDEDWLKLFPNVKSNELLMEALFQ